MYVHVDVQVKARFCYNFSTCSHNPTFMAGNFAYGAIPVANSMAVIPKLQISALWL